MLIESGHSADDPPDAPAPSPVRGITVTLNDNVVFQNEELFRSERVEVALNPIGPQLNSIVLAARGNPVRLLAWWFVNGFALRGESASIFLVLAVGFAAELPSLTIADEVRTHVVDQPLEAWVGHRRCRSRSAVGRKTLPFSCPLAATKAGLSWRSL